MSTTKELQSLSPSRQTALSRMLHLEKMIKMRHETRSSVEPTQLQVSSNTEPQLPRPMDLHFEAIRHAGRPRANRSHSGPVLTLMTTSNTSTRSEPMDPSATVKSFMDDDLKSETTSICRSPTWSRYGDSKKRDKQNARSAKEEREKQKKFEKESRKAVEKTTKETQRPRRLSKLPPVVGNIFPTILYRSETAPAIPTMSDARKLNGHLTELTKGPNVSVRTSSDIGQRASFTHERQSSNENGFIGGLKLRMAEQSAIQQAIDGQQAQDTISVSVQDSAIKADNPEASGSSLNTSFQPTAHRGSVEILPSSAASDRTGRASSSQSEKSFSQESYASRIAKETSSSKSLLVEKTKRGTDRGRNLRSGRYSIAGPLFQDVRDNASTEAVRMEQARAAALTKIASRPRSSDQEKVNLSRQGRHDIGYDINFSQPSLGIDFSRFEGTSEQAPPTAVYATKPGSQWPKQVKGKGIDNLNELSSQADRTTPITGRVRGSSIYMNPSNAFSEPNHISAPPGIDSSNSLVERNRAMSASQVDALFRDYQDRVSPEAANGDPVRRLSQYRSMQAEIVSSGQSDSGSSSTNPSDGRPTSNVDSKITTPNNSRSQSRKSIFNKEQTMPETKPQTSEDMQQPSNPVESSNDSDETQHFDTDSTRIEKGKEAEINTQLLQSVPTSTVNHMSFLPELKHQSLGPSRVERAPTNQTITNRVLPSSISSPESNRLSLPSPISPKSSAYLREARLQAPRMPYFTNPPQRIRPLYPQKRPSSIKAPPAATASFPSTDKPLAKMFVICCQCKYFHDLPSKIYEAMAAGANVVEDKDLGVSGHIKTLVSCPWCSHGMSTECCAGYAAVISLRERFH